MQAKPLESAIEIIPSELHTVIFTLYIDRLYWYSNRFTPKVSETAVVLNIDSTLQYAGYNKDFGPLNIAQVHRYCTQLSNLFKEHKQIVHHCSTHFQKQANACFLMCAYQVVCMGRTPEEPFEPFKSYNGVLIPFVDAGDESVSVKTFELTVLDCVRGLKQAMQLGWYKFNTFDCEAYEKAYTMGAGDMNWIIPNQIMALSSPISPYMVKQEGVKP